MRARYGGLALALALSACGDDGSGPKATTAGSEDGGQDGGGPKDDSGTPATKDSGAPGLDAGRDGTVAPIDAGPQLPDAEILDGNIFLPSLDAGPPPAGWTCPGALWADGLCDCGCSEQDYDCALSTGCTSPGCFEQTYCTACFDVDQSWKPCEPDPDPSLWTCTAGDDNDGLCDCGCGIPDPECGGSGCSESGCYRPACQEFHEGAQGALIFGQYPPFGWTCPREQFGGGDGCDCGCGVHDPDCGIVDCTAAFCVADQCAFCHDNDGRRLPECTATLDKQDSGDWQCEWWRYGSGDGCDCGCSAHDPDCGADGCDGYGCRDDACQRCTDTSFAISTLVGCTPVQWVCGAKHYGTGDGCDCGCGAADPDCGAGGCTSGDCQETACDYCHTDDGKGQTYDNDYIQCTGWTCGATGDDRWALYRCDCGCGKPDPVCRIAGRLGCTTADCKTPQCEHCNGSAPGPCGDPLWSTQNDCLSAGYGSDGLCDCGCGAADPDCATGEGCAAPSCTAQGCDVCYGPSGVMVACKTWTCAPETYADGATCDCGCGAPDPDCSGLGCSEPGCKTDACKESLGAACHDPFGRAVPCP